MKRALPAASIPFYAPSAEQIDGRSYPLDAHLAHKNGEDKLAVIAVLFK